MWHIPNMCETNSYCFISNCHNYCSNNIRSGYKTKIMCCIGPNFISLDTSISCEYHTPVDYIELVLACRQYIYSMMLSPERFIPVFDDSCRHDLRYTLSNDTSNALHHGPRTRSRS